ncbi:hypothetical protein [Methanoculleus bourgensis]|uniref:hypothetical protein n=1 Tax=Methanoculleus bourgensis TaxID=83986 RepID=UPI0022EFA129|nr:hypothetical protein [Methanoculleus bourgensis]GLI46099.1 hypothetical protein MBOURGENBZM_08910 [Methanoculleus bourgensis]
MQLPRGQFHRLIKSTTSRALIEEMGSKRFTGICTILLGNKSAVLVLNEGQVVLAEYGGIKGQQALEKIHDGEEGEAAAELNLLTPDQIQLALEFNQSFAIGNQTDSSPRKAASGGAKPSVQKRRPEPPAERHRIPMPGVKPVRETAAAPPSGDDEINTLIRNMEEMDVEELVSSFRVNCKDMLKKIHLDHLIQEKDT